MSRALNFTIQNCARWHNELFERKREYPYPLGRAPVIVNKRARARALIIYGMPFYSRGIFQTLVFIVTQEHNTE
jgi:hypothetical protein